MLALESGLPEDLHAHPDVDPHLRGGGSMGAALASPMLAGSTVSLALQDPTAGLPEGQGAHRVPNVGPEPQASLRPEVGLEGVEGA